MVSMFLNCEPALGAGEENGEKACSHVSGIGKFRISRRPWTSTIERLMGVNFFQSLNFTSKPKGYLLQTIKLWEKLIALKRKKIKSNEAKRRSKLFKLEEGKVC